MRKTSTYYRASFTGSIGIETSIRAKNDTEAIKEAQWLAEKKSKSEGRLVELVSVFRLKVTTTRSRIYRSARSKKQRK